MVGYQGHLFKVISNSAFVLLLIINSFLNILDVSVFFYLYNLQISNICKPLWVFHPYYLYPFFEFILSVLSLSLLPSLFKI